MGQSKFTLYNLTSTWYTTSYMMTDTLNLLKEEWLWPYLGTELCDEEVTQFLSQIFDARFANFPVTFLYPESAFYI